MFKNKKFMKKVITFFFLFIITWLANGMNNSDIVKYKTMEKEWQKRLNEKFSTEEEKKNLTDTLSANYNKKYKEIENLRSWRNPIHLDLRIGINESFDVHSNFLACLGKYIEPINQNKISKKLINQKKTLLTFAQYKSEKFKKLLLDDFKQFSFFINKEMKRCYPVGIVKGIKNISPLKKTAALIMPGLAAVGGYSLYKTINTNDFFTSIFKKGVILGSLSCITFGLGALGILSFKKRKKEIKTAAKEDLVLFNKICVNYLFIDQYKKKRMKELDEKMHDISNFFFRKKLYSKIKNKTYCDIIINVNSI